ncbi:putative cyclin-dependent kinase F-2 [Sorghum bicolor]|nr:putative cyclin-dependent kinase F-2 [Sorghum bicolor]|eukprot:XP_002466317.2 putative cyclin-dependent kinase F-2 [Sorghum bicolor]
MARILITNFLPRRASPPPPAILPLPPASSPRNHPQALMAACVEAAATGVRDPGAARNNRARARIAVGTTDDYEEICCLGMGAFGAVVKARHRGTGQTVAIKRLAAADICGEMKLLREACLLEASGRDNPFVVGFHGVARNPPTMDLCLVMECVGPSLNDLLYQSRCAGMPPPPEAIVRAVMWQLLTGAKKMHDAHVVHRDIKPENILVGGEGSTVKICDFGLAIRMDESPPYEHVGTLWYMAPEMLLGKPDYDALVDTWSLGCVMAELISGSPLFMASDDAGQLAAIFEVLGAPDQTTWPWFSSTPFAALVQMMPELHMKRSNLLREEFPKTKLSEEGFQLLSGLLTCNPDKRLTAAAALKHPWFKKMNAP